MYNHTYINPNTAYLSSFMGMQIASEGELLTEIQNGLPISALLELQKQLDFPLQATFLELMQMSRTTYNRRKEEGVLTQGESDLLVRIATVYAHALEVFEDAPYVRTWLVTPLASLLGKTPSQYASFELGAAYLHNLLSNLEGGNFFA